MAKFDKYFAVDRKLSGAYHPVSMASLCELLRCSEPTVQRILKHMRENLDAPIERSRQPPGYYYRDRNFQLRGPWLLINEAFGLLFMEQMLSEFAPNQIGKALAPIRSRFGKILSEYGLDPKQAGRFRIVRAFARPIGPYYDEIAAALWQRRRLDLRYDLGDGRGGEECEISPQNILVYRDNFYLDAWCPRHQGIHTVPLDCIEKCRTLDTRADDIDDEVLKRELTSSYGIIPGVPTAIAILLFSPRRARWIARETWHPNQIGTLLADGSYRLEIPYSRFDELILDILRYADDVKVLGPPELAQEVAWRHRAAAAQYP